MYLTSIPKDMKIIQRFLHLIAVIFFQSLQAQTMDFPVISFEKQDFTQFLKSQTPPLHPDVISKVSTILQCRKKIPSLLTVIDYSLPSNYKRLWVFDLQHQKLLFHTYVAHGLFSGEKYTQFFSNENNSRQSSLGVYITGHAYQGREGAALKLEGLDDGMNHNASRRAIVMHGGHYTEEAFIKKYGRAGRSWGCPAIPQSQSQEIINTIKDNQLLIAYYPNEKWFLKSRYLNCYPYSLIPAKHVIVKNVERPPNYHEKNDPVLFATDFKQRFKTESPPVLSVSATVYQKIFNQKPPLSRMLRRSIGSEEYIALSLEELRIIDNKKNFEHLKKLYFIIPNTVHYHGQTKTEMKIVELGSIEELDSSNMIVKTSKYNIQLKESHAFIRWLGL